MKIKDSVWTLPSHWASALINDDRTGLSDDDETTLDSVLAEIGPDWYCVGVSDEPYFTRLHDARQYGVLACDVLDFTFNCQVQDVREELDDYYDDEKHRDAYNSRICGMLLS
jgi:hypothetical protein